MYDLNIAWSPATPTDRLVQTLSLAASMGYETVALNHTLELPPIANPTSSFPKLTDSSSPSTSSNSAAIATSRSSSSSSPPKLPHVLHRVTIPLADPAAPNYRLPTLLGVYDLVAVRPDTEKAFQNACISLDVPLISLDLTQHFPFYFRPKPCMAAVSRGVRFEICYAQLFTADNRGRANFISNATGLFRATRGRGIILSSETKSALTLRAPADVVNLFSVWGLPNQKGLEALRGAPRSVVVNEGLKRTGFRGVVNIVQVAKKDAQEEYSSDSRDTSSEKTASKSAANQKRKTTQHDGQAVSNRQAKKMKLAARKAEKKA